MDRDLEMATPVYRKVRGIDVKFPRILSQEYMALENQVRTARKSFVTGLIETCGIQSPQDKFVAYRDNYSPWVDPNQVAAYLTTYDGARLAVRISLKSDGKTDEQATEVMSSMDHLSVVDVALTVCGFKSDKPVDEKEAGDPKDPTVAPVV